MFYIDIYVIYMVSFRLESCEGNKPHFSFLSLNLDKCHHFFIVLHWAVIKGTCDPTGDGMLSDNKNNK